MEFSFILVLSALCRHRPHSKQQENWISLRSGGKLCLIYMIHPFFTLFKDTAGESSALPRSHAGHRWEENSKNKMLHLPFLAGSIPDRPCFTNTQRPCVLPNNFRLTTHQRNQFRKLDGISFLLTRSDRPSQSINFLVLRLRCSLAERSPAQAARSLTQILIQCF